MELLRHGGINRKGEITKQFDFISRQGFYMGSLKNQRCNNFGHQPSPESSHLFRSRCGPVLSLGILNYLVTAPEKVKSNLNDKFNQLV